MDVEKRRTECARTACKEISPFGMTYFQWLVGQAVAGGAVGIDAVKIAKLTIKEIVEFSERELIWE